jgi:hypothetical protein
LLYFLISTGIFGFFIIQTGVSSYRTPTYIFYNSRKSKIAKIKAKKKSQCSGGVQRTTYYCFFRSFFSPSALHRHHINHYQINQSQIVRGQPVDDWETLERNKRKRNSQK